MSFTSRVYSWTLALRWAKRLIRLWTDSFGPLGSADTRSQMSMMAPQSSDVRFSSVALSIRLQSHFVSGRLWRASERHWRKLGRTY